MSSLGLRRSLGTLVCVGCIGQLMYFFVSMSLRSLTEHSGAIVFHHTIVQL